MSNISRSILGGGSSNIYTALLAGDVDLSVTMTFLSTVLAFGTFPFWIWLLGRNYVDFKTLVFPWWDMSLSLVTLVIPALIGLLLRRYRPVLAFRIGRYLNPIAVGYLVFILTFGGKILFLSHSNSSLRFSRSLHQYVHLLHYRLSRNHCLLFSPMVRISWWSHCVIDWYS